MMDHVEMQNFFFISIYATDVGIDWMHSSWDELFSPWFIFSCWLWFICLTSLYWREASRELGADMKNVDFDMPKSSIQPSGSRCWLVAPWCPALICAFLCFTVCLKWDKQGTHRGPRNLDSPKGWSNRERWPYGERKLLLSVKVVHQPPHHKSPCKRSSRPGNQTLCSN